MEINITFCFPKKLCFPLDFTCIRIVGVANGSGRGHREMKPRLNETSYSHL